MNSSDTRRLPPGAPLMKRCGPCVYYYITHDPNFRYGCRAMDFKSQRQPVLDVIESSGQNCLYFHPKQK
jgi:hypothetical protein